MALFGVKIAGLDGGVVELWRAPNVGGLREVSKRRRSNGGGQNVGGLKHSQVDANIFSLRWVQHKVRAPAPLTTGFVAIPPISRTREWLFSTAPAAPVAASESETREDTRTTDAVVVSLYKPAAARAATVTRRKWRARRRRCAPPMPMIILSAHDPPGGVSTLEPGALPAAVRMAVLA